MRNINKKVKEIKLLEQDQKEGKELKDSQLAKIASKAEHASKIKEQELIARSYLDARAEARADPSSSIAAPVQETA